MITEKQYKILVACKDQPKNPKDFDLEEVSYLSNQKPSLLTTEQVQANADSYNWIRTTKRGLDAISEYEFQKKINKRNSVLFFLGIATFAVAILTLVATVLFGIVK